MLNIKVQISIIQIALMKSQKYVNIGVLEWMVNLTYCVTLYIIIFINQISKCHKSIIINKELISEYYYQWFERSTGNSVQLFQ